MEQINDNERLERELAEALPNSTVRLSGVYRLNTHQQSVFVLGKTFIQSIAAVTASDVTIDGSGAKLILETDRIDHDFCVLHIARRAQNVKLIDLNLELIYNGPSSSRKVTLIFCNGRNFSVDRASLKGTCVGQLNVCGIRINGNVDTHMDTPCDNFILSNSRIELFCRAEETPLENTLTAVENILANSISISGNHIFVQNRGTGTSQRAVGILNSGRFARINGNNVKANGSHNKGEKLEQAAACALANRGVYALVGGNNLVAEWGGTCVGLHNEADYLDAGGNKILSTHTIKGRTVQNSGNHVIVGGNVLTSTSRNARIVESHGSFGIFCGNVLDVLIQPEEMRTGVGFYLEGCEETVVRNNQILHVKTCAIFARNCTGDFADNRILKTEEGSFGVVSDADHAVSRLLDESLIRSV